jgi:hypothetical protein
MDASTRQVFQDCIKSNPMGEKRPPHSAYTRLTRTNPYQLFSGNNRILGKGKKR